MDCPHDNLSGSDHVAAWHLHDNVLEPINGAEEGVKVAPSACKSGPITWRTYSSIRGPTAVNDLTGSSAMILSVLIRVSPDAASQRVVWQISQRGSELIANSPVNMTLRQVEWLSTISSSLVQQLKDAAVFAHGLGLVQDRKAANIQAASLLPYELPDLHTTWDTSVHVSRGVPQIVDNVTGNIVPQTSHATVPRYYRDACVMKGPPRLTEALSSLKLGDLKTCISAKITQRVAPHAKFLRVLLKLCEAGNPFKGASFTINQALWLDENLDEMVKQMQAARDELRLIGIIQQGEATTLEDAQSWLEGKRLAQAIAEDDDA